MHKISVLFLTLQVASCFAYEKFGSVSGYVHDAANQESLIGVNVFIPEIQIGGITNEKGYYVIPRIPNGSYKVVFSYVGYETQTFDFTFENGSKKILKVDLKYSETKVNEVVISAETEEGLPVSEKLYRKQISKVTMKPRDLEFMPQFVEADLLRSLQTLPGVVAVSDFSSALYVRGGTPDQNLILLDGADVYNPEHAFGIFSSFDLETIKQADLYKGGYPSQYGGRLSSVLNIINKDGNREKIGGTVAVSALSSKANLEAPLGKFGSILLSGRRTYLAETIGLFINDLPDYYFYDGSAKAFLDLGSSNKLTLSAYGGRDFLDFRLDQDNPNSSEFNYDWGNKIFSANLTHIFSPTVFSNFGASYSRFSSDFSIAGVDFIERNKVEDLTAKGEVSYLYSSGNKLVTGFEVKHLNLKYFQNWNQTREVDFDENKVLFAGFGKHEWQATKFLNVDYGLRANLFLTTGRKFYGIGPRVSAKYRLTSETTLKASVGKFYQFLGRIPRFIVADVWTSSNKYFEPSNSTHAILGLTTSFFDDFEFESEVYYKTYNDILSFNRFFQGKPSYNELRTRNVIGIQQEFYVTVYKSPLGLFNTGEGRTFGGEMMLKKSFGKTSGWLAYTYSNTRYKFDEVSNGNFYPPRHDRAHVVNLVLNQVLWQSKKNKRKNLTFGTNYVYGSGQPITLPEKFIHTEKGPDTNVRADLYYPLERNGFRIPYYARLDASLTFNVNAWSFFAQIYNVGNRKNIWAVFYNTATEEKEDGNSVNVADITTVTMIPFFPSIGLKYNF